MALNQISSYLDTNGILDDFSFRPQSASQHKNCSCKYINTDAGKITVLVLLNLSAAFDTVDTLRQAGKLGWALRNSPELV